MFTSNTISIESGMGTNNGTFYQPDDPNGLGVLFVHGFLSGQNSYKPYAKALASQGVTCITFDLGCSNTNPNFSQSTIAHNLEEVTSAYGHLTSRLGVKETGIIAASFGAYLTSRLAKIEDTAGLLFRAPAIFPDEIDEILFEDQNGDNLQDFQRHCLDGVADPDLPIASKALLAVSRYKGKLTIVRSELDQVIPKEICRAYAKVAIQGSEKVIAGAKHSLITDSEIEQFKNIAVEWANELVAS